MVQRYFLHLLLTTVVTITIFSNPKLELSIMAKLPAPDSLNTTDTMYRSDRPTDAQQAPDSNQTKRNPDRPELSKVDYILSQRNSNPGQGYYFPPGMTTAEDRQHAQGIENNIGNSEPFLSEFNAYKSKHGYRQLKWR
jgi:hypothetical protein